MPHCTAAPVGDQGPIAQSRRARYTGGPLARCDQSAHHDPVPHYFGQRKEETMAQRKAEKMMLSQRKGVLQSDDWLDQFLGFAGSEG